MAFYMYFSKLLYMCVHACMLIGFSWVWLFVTLWTVVHQSPLCKEFSRQEYWRRLPCPPPEDLPDPGIELLSLMSPVLAGRFFTTSATGEAIYLCLCVYIHICIKHKNIYKNILNNFIHSSPKLRTMRRQRKYIKRRINRQTAA